MPKKPKGGRRNKSWEKIKADYVTDPGLSLKDVSEKYGVPLDTVKKRSKAESWFATKQEHRKLYAAEMAQKLHQKKRESLEQELESAMKASDIIAQMLSDPEQYQRHIVTNILTGTTEEAVFAKYDTKALKDTLACLKFIEDLKRSILGEQRIENIQKHEIESRRVANEEARLAWEKEKSEYAKPDSSNSIRIDGFEVGWSE